MITERDRVLTALRHEQPDITPHQLDFTLEAHNKVAKHLADEDFLDKWGNHLAQISLGDFEYVKPDFVRDHFGVLWNRTVDKDIGIVEGYRLKKPSLDGFQFPDPSQCFRGQSFESFVEVNPDKFRVCGIGFTLFERAWSLRGIEELLVDMYLNPDFVYNLFEGITEYNLQLIDRVLEDDIDCVRFGDDWEQQTGLIFGYELWARFLKPFYEIMFEKVKSKGKYVMLHSCGKVQELFPDLIDMGLDIFNTFQPEIMDPHEMKKEFGSHLTFYGGISTQQVLPFANIEEVKIIVRDMIDQVGDRGGYIVGPTHAMPADIPVENIIAFFEAVRDQ